MRYSIFCTIFFIFYLIPTLSTQDLSGDWYGKLWQDNKQDTFLYQIRLQQHESAVVGQAISTAPNGVNQAEFVISGRWENEQLILQEVEQIRPENRWCLKYIRLNWSQSAPGQQLNGHWTASGCQPGNISISRSKISYEKELPFSVPGRWTGHLSQSDRDYGFYYEMNLNTDGTGSSHLVSEGAGGEATHALQWKLVKDTLFFNEAYVKERTDPTWKWCLKSGYLIKKRKNDAFLLSGNWTGFLEHKSPTSGACAPGNMTMSKPVLTEQVTQQIAPQTTQYTSSSQREVKIDRVLRVQSDNIRIKVWDNGIVDGDVLTLFLNGKQILNKYRVNKRKWSIPVDIIKGENLLILHAEDLGDISPNTVAISIDDGVEEQVVVLSSNLDESGAILIQPFSY